MLSLPIDYSSGQMLLRTVFYSTKIVDSFSYQLELRGDKVAEKAEDNDTDDVVNNQEIIADNDHQFPL